MASGLANTIKYLLGDVEGFVNIRLTMGEGNTALLGGDGKVEDSIFNQCLTVVYIVDGVVVDRDFSPARWRVIHEIHDECRALPHNRSRIVSCFKDTFEA